MSSVPAQAAVPNATWWQRWDTLDNSTNEMASLRVTPPEPFDFSTPDEWPKWFRCFQRFRMASGLASGDEETEDTLIYCMGDKANDILRSFRNCPLKKKYDVIRDKFNDHFVTRQNVIYEHARFNSRRQKPGEPVETFVTALYSLAEHCGYEALHDEMIRDRIVVGIQLSERLQLATLTLAKAIVTVRQAEAVRKQQPVIRGDSNDDQDHPDSPVQAIHGTPQPRKPPTPQQTCQWCGKTPTHERRRCPARSVTCHRCSKKGHFQLVCQAPTHAPVHLEEDETDPFIGVETCVMFQMLAGLPGTVCMMDDVFVHGATQEEHDDRLCRVLKWIQDSGMTLNPEKCEFSRSCVTDMSLTSQGSALTPTRFRASSRQPPRNTSATCDGSWGP